MFLSEITTNHFQHPFFNILPFALTYLRNSYAIYRKITKRSKSVFLHTTLDFSTFFIHLIFMTIIDSYSSDNFDVFWHQSYIKLCINASNMLKCLISYTSIFFLLSKKLCSYNSNKNKNTTYDFS